MTMYTKSHRPEWTKNIYLELDEQQADELQAILNDKDRTPEEITMEIVYVVVGKYYPATRDQPEEFPELEMDRVNYTIHYQGGVEEKVKDKDEKALEDWLEKNFPDYFDSSKLDAVLWEDFDEQTKAWNDDRL